MTEIVIENFTDYEYASDEDAEYSVSLIIPDDRPTLKCQKSHDLTSSSNFIVKDYSDSFHEFMSRQVSANDRHIKNRDHPPSERRFITKPYNYVLKSSVPPEREKVVTKNNSLRLFEESISRKKKSVENPNQSLRLISQNSQSIVEKKNALIIKEICGVNKIANTFQIETIIRHLNIKSTKIANELIQEVKINQDQYDVEKLKQIIISTLNKDDGLSPLELKIKPSLSYALRNDKMLIHKGKKIDH
ncbi:hypothetical protein TRFO_18426 [Tritrichomonas foetus]|uniref:Uncharacterized protein n=1 Tax=Tritrichomonas foetus TaxID=1144522 RepID=A0A1J4KKW3_9EUKA|nr:hypothetical protein TRFO_18426 [Tritrichomonas foetus]|eukprot:OHT11945.1 hypothetical protein TRFO_18426 [Tritrichomonas foetus]